MSLIEPAGPSQATPYHRAGAGTQGQPSIVPGGQALPPRFCRDRRFSATPGSLGLTLAAIELDCRIDKFFRG
jgi:hypothetical protein